MRRRTNTPFGQDAYNPMWTKNLPRVNQKVNQKSSIGTFIATYTKYPKRIVASIYGYIRDPSEVEDDKASNLNENDLISVKIVNVKIPGLIVDWSSSSDGCITLDSFGSLPLCCYISTKCLRTASEIIFNAMLQQRSALPDYLMKAYNISQKKQSSTPQDSMSLKLAVQISIRPIAMLPTVVYFDGSFLYTFLAERQNTNIAIMAVHTDEEMVLFAKFKTDAQMKEMIKYSAEKTSPYFEVLASIWSTYCVEGFKIYYKLPRHLESYFNILTTDRERYHKSVSLNAQIREVVMDKIQNDDRLTGKSIPVPPIAKAPSSKAVVGNISNSSASTYCPLLYMHHDPFMIRPPPSIVKLARAPRICALCNIRGCGGGRYHNIK
ncbi:hypothetical protein [Parasitella parasitica]|uniref:Uncharacterized protein n=1 Tax=Parasitella parasitica TaxID=35722 RepID=A0A0B7NWQ1_9FUNG|nr:hypothetical protein [Parasitella parasitica]